MNTTKLMMMAAVAGVMLGAEAMPKKSELEKALPLVQELMAPKVDELKAKKITAAELADAVMEYYSQAESEAAKFLLLKGAIAYYARGEKYDKAADAAGQLKNTIKDIPPSVMTDILEKASGKVTKKKAPRLFAMLKAAKLQVKAVDAAKVVGAQLATKPNDLKLRRKYAEYLAASGRWEQALEEFAKLGEPMASVAKREIEGKAKNEDQGEYWWNYEPSVEGVGDAFKTHAVEFYRKGVAADEIKGLKAKVIAKRIEEFGDDDVNEFKVAKKEAAVRTDADDSDKDSKAEEVANEEEIKQVVKSKVLSGTQSEKSLLIKAGTYQVQGMYIIPSECRLEIASGAILEFEEKAGILVDGSLSIVGTVAAPVVLKGKRNRIDAWEGITAHTKGDVSIVGAVISGARRVVDHGEIRKSSLKGNQKISDVCVKLRLEDCLVVDNDYGIDVYKQRLEIQNCTFRNNGGRSVSLTAAEGDVADSQFVNNRGRAFFAAHWGRLTVNGCEIHDNKEWDVDTVGGGKLELDFTGNFWGDKNTVALKKANDNSACLPGIHDRKCGEGLVQNVDISKALLKAPKGCGAREYPKVK